VFPALAGAGRTGRSARRSYGISRASPTTGWSHALFVDDADLALVLFDARTPDPLHGVGFWLKQLRTGQSRCPIILVAAQTDRGSCTLTPEELDAFCAGTASWGRSRRAR